MKFSASGQNTMTDYHSESASRPFDKSDILNSRHFDKSDISNSTSRSLNPEVLMRDFLNDVDDQVSSDEASSGFKSSFAREVMQNVRRNVANQNGPARRYLAISQQGSIKMNSFDGNKHMTSKPRRKSRLNKINSLN